MSISAPQPGWWNIPVHKEEKRWITIAFVWCIFITVAMPWWHVLGKQNTQKEYYTIEPGDFDVTSHGNTLSRCAGLHCSRGDNSRMGYDEK